MNDFTKEELKMISACLLPSPDDNFPWTEAQINLHIKTRSMIDNYCEHEWFTFMQDSASNEPFIEKCIKCHELRFINENQ